MRTDVFNNHIGGKMTGNEIKNKVIKYLVLLIISGAVLCTGYVMIVLNVSYSKGERIGYVQKFSEKGWLCKTWEGELQMLPIPGALPEKFSFSVRDKTVIGQINSSLGKKVALSYQQHKGVPSTCFGESEYFAVNVRPLD